MPVTDITKDVDAARSTITAEFAAPVERVWALYADPRQLEQVWGPPEYPATFVDHDLRPGGRMTYYMTSPRARGSPATGTSSRSTSRAASPSTTGSPTPTSTPTPTCRSRTTTTPSARPTAAPGPCSSAPSTPPRTCRRCSTWASRRAHRRHQPDRRLPREQHPERLSEKAIQHEVHVTGMTRCVDLVCVLRSCCCRGVQQFRSKRDQRSASRVHVRPFWQKHAENCERPRTCRSTVPRTGADEAFGTLG